jgi:hypothetical protein
MGRVRAVAVGTVLCVAAAACSNSADTTQIAADEVERKVAPTTSIVRTQLPTTTTTASTTTVPARAAGSPATLAGTLGVLVNSLAADPSIARMLAGGLELPDLAALVGIELPDLEQLQLTMPQLEQLALSVLAQPQTVLSQLATGPPDAATLLAVLGRSVDIGELTGGAIGALVAALVASIGDLRVSPQLTIQLGELLDGLDPAQLGPIAADPGNAAFFALLLSAFIGSNPLLAQQLLGNELLEPGLRDLLLQLQALNASLSDAATQALLETLRQLFPGLIPPA